MTTSTKYQFNYRRRFEGGSEEGVPGAEAGVRVLFALLDAESRTAETGVLRGGASLEDLGVEMGVEVLSFEAGIALALLSDLELGVLLLSTRGVNVEGVLMSGFGVETVDLFSAFGVLTAGGFSSGLGSTLTGLLTGGSVKGEEKGLEIFAQMNGK